MELVIIEEWLRSRLKGSFASNPVEPAPYDVELGEIAIIYKYMSGIDLRNYGTVKLGEEVIYQVTVEAILPDTPNIGPLKLALKIIDQVLDNASGSTGDGSVWSCRKVGSVNYPYTDDSDRKHQVAGGRYAIRAGVVV